MATEKLGGSFDEVARWLAEHRVIARSSMPSGSQQAPAAVDFGARAEPRLRAKRDKNISPTSSGEWSSDKDDDLGG